MLYNLFSLGWGLYLRKTLLLPFTKFFLEIHVKDLGHMHGWHLLHTVFGQGGGGADSESSWASNAVVGPLQGSGVIVGGVCCRKMVVVIHVVVDLCSEGLGSEVVGRLNGPLVVVSIVPPEVELLVVWLVEAVQVPANGGSVLVVDLNLSLQAVILALDGVLVLHGNVLVSEPGVREEGEGRGVATHVVGEGKVSVLSGREVETIAKVSSLEARVIGSDLERQVVVVEPGFHTGGNVILVGAVEGGERLQFKLDHVVLSAFYVVLCCAA